MSNLQATFQQTDDEDTMSSHLESRDTKGLQSLIADVIEAQVDSCHGSVRLQSFSQSLAEVKATWKQIKADICSRKGNYKILNKLGCPMSTSVQSTATCSKNMPKRNSTRSIDKYPENLGLTAVRRRNFQQMSHQLQLCVGTVNQVISIRLKENGQKQHCVDLDSRSP